MRAILLFSFVFYFLFHKTIAQSPETSISSTPTTTLSPAAIASMSAASVASVFSSLATASPEQPGSGPTAGDAGSSGGSSSADSEAGASGSDSGSITLSKEGIIVIAVVVSAICVFGIISSVLFYLAKKRSWEVRKTIRKSARRVATALTPRRSTFPKDVQRPRRSSRGLTRIDEVPPTPKTHSADIEKDGGRMSEFELAEPPKHSKWARKMGR